MMAKAILELSKMPQSCRECPLQAISEKKIKYCTVIGYSIDYYGTKRRENCPLKPIEKPTKQPEHCPNCGYKTVTDGKHVCCFACGYNV